MVFVSGVMQTGFVKAAAVIELSAYDCPLFKDTFDCIPKLIILYDVTLLRDKLQVRDTCNLNRLL